MSVKGHIADAHLPARAWTVLAAILVALTLPTAARADGLPLIGLSTTHAGIDALDGSAHYYAVPDGQNTSVLAMAADGSRIAQMRRLSGTLAVPGVGYDGATSGLSADGGMLVLIEPRTQFPRAETPFVLLDTERLQVRDRFTLKGDFSFDAISPDGSTLYLIEYPSRDPTIYSVRAFDVATATLDPNPIVDPNEPPGEMRGNALTRVEDPTGRWAYTLYDGGGETPFVHALDTEAGQAVCVDLDALDGIRNPSKLLLSISDDGSAISVLKREREGARVEVAAIDTSTLEAGPPLASSADDSGALDGVAPWLIGFAGAGALLAAVTAGRTVRRRRRTRMERSPA